MRLFDPDIQPKDIRPKQQRVRNVWFRPSECLRLIYDDAGLHQRLRESGGFRQRGSKFL